MQQPANLLKSLTKSARRSARKPLILQGFYAYEFIKIRNRCFPKGDRVANWNRAD